MNSDKLHHFQTSTFFILSAKVWPQWGSMASMRFSLQPPTGGHSPREETAMSTAGTAGMSLEGLLLMTLKASWGLPPSP